MANEDNINRRIHRNGQYPNSVNPFEFEFSISVPRSSLSRPNININVQPQIVNGYIVPSPNHHHHVPYHNAPTYGHHMFLSSNTFPYHHHHNHHLYQGNINQAIANLHSQHAMNTQAVRASNNNNYAVPPPPPPRPPRGYNLNAALSDEHDHNVSNENNAATPPEDSPEAPDPELQEPQAAAEVAAAAQAGSSGSRVTTFDCNICLGSPREAVVTLCGHLFCWKCLYLSHCARQVCPVCKARLLRLHDVVVPVYGGGGRHDGASASSGNRIPPRPRGHLAPGSNNNNTNELDLFPM